MKPSILLVDEPSIGLEPRYIQMVFEILDDLQKNDLQKNDLQKHEDAINVGRVANRLTSRIQLASATGGLIPKNT